MPACFMLAPGQQTPGPQEGGGRGRGAARHCPFTRLATKILTRTIKVIRTWSTCRVCRYCKRCLSFPKRLGGSCAGTLQCYLPPLRCSHRWHHHQQQQLHLLPGNISCPTTTAARTFTSVCASFTVTPLVPVPATVRSGWHNRTSPVQWTSKAPSKLLPSSLASRWPASQTIWHLLSLSLTESEENPERKLLDIKRWAGRGRGGRR